MTLTIGADGALTAHVPTEIVFRDGEGIRPVCPFFELHAEYDDAQGRQATAPLTLALLESWGATAADIVWSVVLGNLKAFHYTRRRGDRVEAKARIAADQHARIALQGVSPTDDGEPVVRASHPLPMGEIQIPRPDSQHPEMRLRFYPPAGHIYGPENLAERIDELEFGYQDNKEWQGFSLPPERLIVNPAASWPRYVPSMANVGPFNEYDYRNTPGGLLAAPISPIPWRPDDGPRQRSLGLLDDVSDGFVACEARINGTVFTARARIVVGPPDFAPANRPPVSLADNLADRELRDEPRQASWSDEELAAAVLDIFERAFETSDLMHRDYQNLRSRNTNDREYSGQGRGTWLDPEDLDTLLWPAPDAASIRNGLSTGMPVVEAGTRQHRRHNVMMFLADRMRENPQVFDQWIRRPLDPAPFYDKRMPALMRGSDGRPHHLTRRQWELFRLWIKRIRDAAPNAGPAPPGAGD